MCCGWWICTANRALFIIIWSEIRLFQSTNVLLLLLLLSSSLWINKLLTLLRCKSDLICSWVSPEHDEVVCILAPVLAYHYRAEASRHICWGQLVAPTKFLNSFFTYFFFLLKAVRADGPAPSTFIVWGVPLDFLSWPFEVAEGPCMLMLWCFALTNSIICLSRPPDPFAALSERLWCEAPAPKLNYEFWPDEAETPPPWTI